MFFFISVKEYNLLSHHTIFIESVTISNNIILLQNSLELDKLDTQNDIINTSISLSVQKAAETKKTLDDGILPQMKVEKDNAPPMTVRMRTGMVNNHYQ